MPSDIVTIDAPDKIVTCDAQGGAQHVFSVKNTSGRSLTVGARVMAEDATQEGWLKVEAPSEQQLADNALTQIPVKIQVPGDAAPGRYRYRLLVYSVRNAGEEFTEGEAVAFEVIKQNEVTPQPEPARRWWIWVVLGALLLAAGGGLAWYLTREKPVEKPEVKTVSVPALTSLDIIAAQKKIVRAGLIFDVDKLRYSVVPAGDVGKVVDQDPEADTVVNENTEVIVTLGAKRRNYTIPVDIRRQLMVPHNVHTLAIPAQPLTREVEAEQD